VDTTAAGAYLHLAVPVRQAATSSPSAALGGAGSVRVTVLADAVAILACGVVGSDVVAVPQPASSTPSSTVPWYRRNRRI
jgi:hypothetical protein